MPTTGSTSTGYAHFIILVIIYSSSMVDVYFPVTGNRNRKINNPEVAA